MLDVNKNIIQIYYNKNIKLFQTNIINLVLKNCQYKDQIKKHYLILKITIFCLERYFIFNFFENSHLIINIIKIKLIKLPNLSKKINKFSN